MEIERRTRLEVVDGGEGLRNMEEFLRIYDLEEFIQMVLIAVVWQELVLDNPYAT